MINFDEHGEPSIRANPPYPDERESEGGFVRRWLFELGGTFNREFFMAESPTLTYEGLRVELQNLSGRRCTLSVFRDREFNYGLALNCSFRALLLIERFMGPIESIEGVPRQEWSSSFLIAEHDGVLESDKAPLIRAAERGDNFAVESLLNSNADINVTSPTGGTALMYAAYRGHVDVVKTLLRHGADVQPPGKEFTLMQNAVVGGIELVRLLLDAGADVNATDLCGRTALMSAAILGKFDAVKLLLETGADRTLRDYWGKSALDRTAMRPDIAELLTKP
jgi:hypothetical protein